MFDHLLELSHQDDSNKKSHTGFGEKLTQVVSIEVNFYASYLQLWYGYKLPVEVCGDIQDGHQAVGVLQDDVL